MKLFKGQIEVRETDVIEVYRDFLRVLDKNDNQTYYEDSDEYWIKQEYDKQGNMTYYENSNKFWSKQEYDKNGNRNYYENSDGKIIDNRLKEITIEELTKMGYKLKEK